LEEAIQWVIVGDSGTHMKSLLKPVDNCICKEEISNRDPILMIEDFLEGMATVKLALVGNGCA